MKVLMIMISWLAFATTGSAQTDWQQLQAIAKDQTIRVRTTDGRQATGTIIGLDDMNLSIISSQGDVARFTRDTVQLIERQGEAPRGRSRGVVKGLIWGAVTGVGLSLGPMFAGAAEPVPYMIAGAAVIGAGIGAWRADTHDGRWFAVYRR